MFDPWDRKLPWRRKWQPTPVFLPGQSPWTEKLGRLQSIGSQGVGHDLVTKQQKSRLHLSHTAGSETHTETSSFSTVSEHLAKTTVNTPHVAVWHTSYFTLHRHTLGCPVRQSTYDVTMCDAMMGSVLCKHFLGDIIKYP